MRVVLDSNVILSGLMSPKGTTGTIIQAWKDSRLTLLICEVQLEEIKRVLAYPKIQKRLNWSAEKINLFVKLLAYRSEYIDISGVGAYVPQDADDEMLLATLIAAKADYLVTGDSDLLALRENYAIITPAQFLVAWNIANPDKREI
jgi:putative PIN family toxin of toxin-antitoxin system